MEGGTWANAAALRGHLDEIKARIDEIDCQLGECDEVFYEVRLGA